jgi:hypothetical protein
MVCLKNKIKAIEKQDLFSLNETTGLIHKIDLLAENQLVLFHFQQCRTNVSYVFWTNLLIDDTHAIYHLFPKDMENVRA